MRDAEDDGENRTGIVALRSPLLTGCRRNEILALPWAWLDPKAHCIRFGDTKSGAQLRPIGTTAAKYLASQTRREGYLWVFPADRGGRALYRAAAPTGPPL
jgi:integrase